MGEILQPSEQLYGPLQLFQQLHIFLMLRAPELDATLQVKSQRGAEWQNSLPPCWPRCIGWSPAHIAGSCQTSCQPTPPRQKCLWKVRKVIHSQEKQVIVLTFVIMHFVKLELLMHVPSLEGCMRWGSEFAFLHFCNYQVSLSPPGPPVCRVRFWSGTALTAKELEEGAWEDGLMDSLNSVPKVLSSVPQSSSFLGLNILMD